MCVDLPAIQVRLLRHNLPDGSVAVCLTSLLDQQGHPAATPINLYAQRWRIETTFRGLKSGTTSSAFTPVKSQASPRPRLRNMENGGGFSDDHSLFRIHQQVDG